VNDIQQTGCPVLSNQPWKDMDSLPETAERAAEDGNVEATLNSPVKKVGAEQNGPHSSDQVVDVCGVQGPKLRMPAGWFSCSDAR
jgi:hypothetical protein